MTSRLPGERSMLHQVIDRRLSGKNKSIGNRERFLRRYRDQIRDAVRKAVGDRSIRDIEEGRMPKDDNPLVYAPHTADVLVSSDWTHPYTREQAAFPAPWTRKAKFWPSEVSVDSTPPSGLTTSKRKLAGRETTYRLFARRRPSSPK